MKKLFAILLALIMLFALVACGGKDNPAPPVNDDPTVSQQDETPDANGESETTPSENVGNSEDSALFGWTEDDFKPDDIFADMTYEEGMGYFISTTEPLGAEGFKAWYHKLASKIETLADDGTYTIANVPDLDEYLSQAVEAYES